MGDGTLEQHAEILSWMSWANQELGILLLSFLVTRLYSLCPVSNLHRRSFWPLIPNSLAPFNKASIEGGKAAGLIILEGLEATLVGRKYHVGDHITLADIIVVEVVGIGLQWALGPEWRKFHT
jgi:elongation factor 1-gamma